MMQSNLKRLIFLLIFLAAFISTHAKETKPILEVLNQFLNTTIEWRIQQKAQSQEPSLKLTTPILLAGVLCFVASSISSAGGIGGGGLFIPILTIVAGLDLKMASSFSAFMVTGGSIPNVVSNMFITSKKNGDKTLIDYDIALFSEPCMLLGVSIGVVCNIMFPEWLITVMFAIFLAWSTFKTFKSGISYWKLESAGMSRNGCQKLENGLARNGLIDISDEGVKEPLLRKETRCKLDIPWMKLGVLAMIWFSFFVLYLLRGNRYGQGIIPIETCGVGYWVISAAQIPLTIIFTSCMLYRRESVHNQQELGGDNKNQGPVKLIFPVMAFLAGALVEFLESAVECL